MRKFSLYLLISLVLCLTLIACSKTSKEEKNFQLATGRATVILDVATPSEDFNDILYVDFVDMVDNRNVFTITLSKSNEYKMTISVPAGKYAVSGYRFNSGADYYFDLSSFDIPKIETYTISSNISYDPIESLDYVGDEGSSFGTTIFFISAIVIALILVAVILLAARRNKTLKTVNDQADFDNWE